MVEPKDEIVNRVANSGLVTINLEEICHAGEQVLLDIAPWLFKGLILKEADFRTSIQNHDWQHYAQKNVAITCSADAIIPTWAYMLVTISLAPYANCIVLGSINDLQKELYTNAIKQLNKEDFRDKRVIVKGCSDGEIPTQAYVEITNKLLPVVKSLMYGEACSNVPLYKQKK